jgi:hypothetical protein
VLLARRICLLLSGAGSGYLSADVRAWSQYFAMPPPLMSILKSADEIPPHADVVSAYRTIERV